MNPYQAPQADPAPIVAGAPGHDQLRLVARHQRSLNLAILAQILLYLTSLVFKPTGDFGDVAFLALMVGAIAVAIFSIVATVRLANALHGTGAAIAYAVMMFIPCLSLVALLVLNQTATGRLRNAGYKVGLLGVKPGDLG